MSVDIVRNGEIWKSGRNSTFPTRFEEVVSVLSSIRGSDRALQARGKPGLLARFALSQRLAYLDWVGVGPLV
jgi:hypothetical protein